MIKSCRLIFIFLIVVRRSLRRKAPKLRGMLCKTYAGTLKIF